MQKIITIFFIVLLINAQYTKQLSYIGCQFFNKVAKSSLQCDCEKILTYKEGAHRDVDGTTVHKHFHIDDYEINKKTSSISSLQIENSKHFFSTKTSFYFYNYNNKLLKPPQV